MKSSIAILCLAAACTPASELVRTSPEAAGANCAHGGIAVQQGTDDNDDGILQPDEVDETQYVCNGDPGSAAIVDVGDEPAGANCDTGGSVVRVGTDLNANGMLDSDEVVQTVYVCRGADGATQLVETQPEPAGGHCITGGVAILVGTDTDADGMLSTDEVSSTSYVCNGSFTSDTIAGPYTISNELDIALLAGIHEVTVELRAEAGAPLDTIVLPDLLRAGAVRFDSPTLHHISLPNLTTVTHDAWFGRNDQGIIGDTLDISSLQSVGGDLGIRLEVQVFSAPVLASVGGEFSFAQATSVQSISAPQLTSVGYRFAAAVLPSLQQVHLESLAQLGGIDIFNCPSLAESGFHMPAVGALPNQMSLNVIPWTTLGPLGSVTSSAWISVGGQQLTTVAFPRLTTAGTFSVGGAAIESFSAPMLQTIAGPVSIYAPQLSTCALESFFDAIGYTGERLITAGPC